MLIIRFAKNNLIDSQKFFEINVEEFDDFPHDW
jgi:hypothetical protein